MLRGYRSKLGTIAGLTIVCLGIFFLVLDLSAVDSAYRHAATDSSIEYQRNADANVKKRCFSTSDFGQEDCTAQADEAAREGQRKEQDLAAQNVTAWWTKVTGVAAVIGMALSAVGVWLVKTTFDVAVKANIIAEKAATNQLQPYVGFISVTIDPKNIGFWVKIQNFGQTPAKEVNLETTEPNGDQKPHKFGVIDPGQSVPALVRVGPGIIDDMIQNETPYFLVCKIEYTDFFQNSWTRKATYSLHYRKRSPEGISQFFLDAGTSTIERRQEKD